MGAEYGILTAAHCFNGNGVNIQGIGTVKKWQKSGSVDAAWIKTLTSNTPTNILAYKAPSGGTGPVLTTVMTSFLVGQRLGKVGGISNWTSGKVTSTVFNSLGLTGLVKTDVWSQEGDSGGLVFGNPQSAAVGVPTAGLVQGGPIKGGPMHFSRADRINSSFGISRY